MPKQVFSFPDSLDGFLVDDELFARAYGESADRERAWMKTCIARLYEWYGPRRDRAGRIAESWRSGLESVRAHEPVDFAVVLIGGGFASPARLLASLVPSLACGVEHVLVVRVDGEGDFPSSLLTGMELAGQELVAAMGKDDVLSLLRTLAEAGRSGAVVDLAGLDDPCPEQGRVAWYRPVLDGKAAVFMEDGATFDLEALAFSHPGSEFVLYGADVDLPAGFVRGGGGEASFLNAVTDVAYAPFALAGEALEAARLVLGPGQEGCWVWPGLHPEFFLFHRTSWTLGD
ncbi:MAG: hypothetical protein AB7E51_15255 [Pseudodesulfovibrio sp.]|uniref:hypothetical protein n=1 Tax=Pseudodesulfovibrio sp. TaxID=2035812 RepID=UPI003D0983CC